MRYAVFAARATCIGGQGPGGRDEISRIAGAITVLELTPGKPDKPVSGGGIMVSLDERLCCLEISHPGGFEGIADEERLSIAYNLVVPRNRLCANRRAREPCR